MGLNGAVTLYAEDIRALADVWPRRVVPGWYMAAYHDYGVYRENGDDNDGNGIPVLSRRCDAKRAAEVLAGQWWREKCEREAKRKALRRRHMVAMKDNGECLFDRMAKAACAAWADVSALEGADLDRLAEVHGVEARSGE